MLTIEQLTAKLTSDEVLERYLEALETLGVPARSWVPAGKLRTVMRVTSIVFAGLTETIRLFVDSGFVDRAEGVWLTRLARYVYGVDRIPATFARGTLTIVNEGGGVYSFGPREVTAKTSDGRLFVNVASLTIGALATVDATFEALEAGSKNSAAAGTISSFETTISSRVTCSNAGALIGTDEELDPNLRDRCKAAPGARSPNGPRAAYVYAITSAKRLDGTPVDVNRYTVSPSSDDGTVTIRVASPSGPPLPEDLDAIRTSIETLARTDTDTVNVAGTTVVVVPRTFTAWARSSPGVKDEAVRKPSEDALIALERDYPIGGIAKSVGGQGYLYSDAMKAAIKTAHPLVFDVDVDVDTDVALSTSQIPRIAATIVVRFV